MDHGSLYDVIHVRKVKLDYEQILKMIKDIAIGMQYLHSRNIMHCDLKSSNILLDASYKIRITDFGNSKFKRKKDDDDNFGRVGTPHWMAPEILRGEAFVPKSDVYSFGIILLELLESKIPFREMTLTQLIGVIGHLGRRPVVKNKNNTYLNELI